VSYKFKYHIIRDGYSTFVHELPEGDQVIAVYARQYFEWMRAGLKMEGKILKSDTAFYAFGYVRRTMPNVIGEGKTKEEAVDNLLAIVLTHG